MDLLSESDQLLFTQNRLAEMSIFSKKVTLKRLGDYEYFETHDNEPIYYINLHIEILSSFFIDNNKKIIFNSRYYHTYGYLLNFLPNLLKCINNINLDESIYIGNNIISISKWFVSYGHYKDESFALCDFKNKFLLEYPNNAVNTLIEYHTDNICVTNYPVFPSYNVISNHLFDGTNINPYEYNKQILKMNKLLLIKHYYEDKTFHAFPIYPRNLILDKLKNMPSIYNKNIFITRNIALHIKRNLDNEQEICDYLSALNYVIINPENITYNEFINNIKESENVVMTWGGALTNMIYFKPGTHIYILKSKSYEDESIELFRKIITTYQVNITIITHVDNKISIPFL